jgi:predicted amidohydrolase
MAILGICVTQGQVKAVYQQRTVHPGEKTDDVTARVAEVASARAGLLICDGVHNPALVQSLGDERPDFVVDTSHKSMGRKFTSTLRNAAAAAGCRVLHAQHVALRSRGASK